jgi:integrase/recombinase XerD
MTRLRQRMLEELQRRNYAQATIDAYIFAVQEFSQYFGRSPVGLGAEDLRRYQLYLLREKRLSSSTVEVRISALRFLYKRVLRRADLAFDDLPFPKATHTLPTVLSRQEVTRLIDAAANPKHRTLLMLLYGTGMRRSEAARLTIADIDSQRMVIHMHQSKGRRDRDA